MRSFFAAIRFLTIFPVPSEWCGGERELARGVWFFPVVGALLGGGIALADHWLVRTLPIFPESVLIVILLLAVSGGLHMDGLSDTADGVLSARPRERILEIMKDSHVGAMGVMAIVVVLLFKTSILVLLETPQRGIYLFLTPLLGRASFLFPMALSRYARENGGLGSVFARRRTLGWLAWGGLWMIVPSVFFLGREGGILAISTLGLVALFTWYMQRKIGGWTGDTLGALCELCELLPALVGIVVIFHENSETFRIP